MKEYSRLGWLHLGLTGVIVVSELFLPVAVKADLSANVNNVTGPNSQNDNITNQKATVNLTITNNNKVTNNTDLKLNTGNNAVKNNTESGGTKTGTITTNLETNNITAQSAIPLTIGSNISTSSTSSNLLTGPNSENKNTTTINHSFVLDINNVNNVNNIAHITANTGGNTERKNTFVGPIRTGDIYINTKFSTVMEPTIPVIKISTPPTIVNPPIVPTTPSFPSLTPPHLTIPVPSVPMQTPGMGGGFFPSGSNMLPELISIMIAMVSAMGYLLFHRRSHLN